MSNTSHFFDINIYQGVDMLLYILFILAIVQGATEFLPISSSGHLVLLYNIFGIHDDQIILTILMHVATLVAIIIYYRKEIIALILHPLCPTNFKLLVSTISTAAVYLCIHRIVDAVFSGRYIFICFIITAMLLIISEYVTERKQILSRTKQIVLESLHCDTLDITHFPISYTGAIVLGLTQGVAILPGISRSGSTIAIGNMMGINHTPTYSFLMSIPVIIGSLILTIATKNISISISVVGLILSMVLCAIVGVASIWIVNKLNTKNKLSYFAYYLILLSTILVIMSFV